MTQNAMRIVHFFREPDGGVFRHVRDLTEAQFAAGHAVGIVCDSTTGGEFADSLFEALRPMLALGVRRMPMQRRISPGDAVAACRSYRIIKELRPDVLHGHGAKGGVYARLLGTRLRVSRSRVARLYSPHGGSLHYAETTWSGRLFFMLERLMERFTDHLLFVSDYERRTFRRKIGEPTVPSSVVYNGLRETEFEPVEPQADAADFLYIGMMRDLKGPDLFIEALARAEGETARTLRAVMVGDGDDLPRYRQMVQDLGLAGRVTFLKPMLARQAFALARVIVVPSRAEVLGYVVLEALAAGMPVIASAVGGIPEIFGEDSLALVQPSAEAICSRMATALADPEGFKAAMPVPAELRARFGVETMAADVQKAYYACLNG